MGVSEHVGSAAAGPDLEAKGSAVAAATVLAATGAALRPSAAPPTHLACLCL